MVQPTTHPGGIAEGAVAAIVRLVRGQLERASWTFRNTDLGAGAMGGCWQTLRLASDIGRLPRSVSSACCLPAHAVGAARATWQSYAPRRSTARRRLDVRTRGSASRSAWRAWKCSSPTNAAACRPCHFGRVVAASGLIRPGTQVRHRPGTRPWRASRRSSLRRSPWWPRQVEDLGRSSPFRPVAIKPALAPGKPSLGDDGHGHAQAGCRQGLHGPRGCAVAARSRRSRKMSEALAERPVTALGCPQRHAVEMSKRKDGAAASARGVRRVRHGKRSKSQRKWLAHLVGSVVLERCMPPG